jgi:mono/diheme cytochrome c family protein
LIDEIGEEMAKQKISWFVLNNMIVWTAIAGAEIFLPGMQPKEAGIEFAKVQQCKMCHGATKNGDADPVFSWQGGMMAQAAKDPVFRAALAIAEQDVPGVGEYCFRCHTPRGWLEGRSTPSDGSALNREDMQGVSCDVCHRLVDPQSDRARELIEHIPPGYGNAMIVADPRNIVMGPYGDSKGVARPHQVEKSEYHASSKLCATCHNISHPLLADDVMTQPPYAYGHIERTYSEWLLSDYPNRGKEGTCQSCHYPKVEGGGQASRYGSQHRDYFVKHGPVGGSTWVQDVTWLLWDGKDMDKKAFEASKKRALALLQTAAKLEWTATSEKKMKLRITNRTGHKLPNGYAEGRRMWVNVRFLDTDGALLKEIGKYDQLEDKIFKEAVTVPTLLDPDKTTVYECHPGISPEQAKKFNKKPGKSFHFVLNDTIVKDNRIPPEGFNNATFKEHLSEPVGATYQDGQYWDDIEYDLPEKCAQVEARLMYQSVSWEYIKFLAEENRTDDWGKRLYEAWRQTGECEPVVMASVKKEI